MKQTLNTIKSKKTKRVLKELSELIRKRLYEIANTPLPARQSSFKELSNLRHKIDDLWGH